MIGENGFIKQMKLTNFLSYGNDSEEVEVKSLNVLIGPNTSGKSNFIEALRLLHALPQKGAEDIFGVLRKGGGVSDWIWKGGQEDAIARIELITESDIGFDFLMRYTLEFRKSPENRFELVSEQIIRQKIGTTNYKDHQHDYFYQTGSPPSLVTYVYEKDELFKPGELEEVKSKSFRENRSVLSQRYDYEKYPNLTYIADRFEHITIFSEWDLDNSSPLRNPQSTTDFPDYLLEDASNLYLILHFLLESTDTSNQLYNYLRNFSWSFDHIIPSIVGGKVQFFIHEKGLNKPIPTIRLSEGYIRFLCLLAILIHPKPPPVICLEEPEQCMHPDVIPVIAELLINASQRTQLFVTTHSDHLISALTDVPESVIVCERMISGTHLKRLEKEHLKNWLKEYTLGDLWGMGEIGGNP